MIARARPRATVPIRQLSQQPYGSSWSDSAFKTLLLAMAFFAGAVGVEA
jgi:hypothetical protein